MKLFADTASRPKTDTSLRGTRNYALSGNKCGLYGHVYSFFVRHTHWKQIFFRYVSISSKQKEGDGTYRLTCETAGTVGNNDVGTILPVNYIEGLETAKLIELIIP